MQKRATEIVNHMAPVVYLSGSILNRKPVRKPPSDLYRERGSDDTRKSNAERSCAKLTEKIIFCKDSLREESLLDSLREESCAHLLYLNSSVNDHEGLVVHLH